jgi:hypothetical protein
MTMSSPFTGANLCNCRYKRLHKFAALTCIHGSAMKINHTDLQIAAPRLGWPGLASTANVWHSVGNAVVSVNVIPHKAYGRGYPHHCHEVMKE